MDRANGRDPITDLLRGRGAPFKSLRMDDTKQPKEPILDHCSQDPDLRRIGTPKGQRQYPLPRQ